MRVRSGDISKIIEYFKHTEIDEKTLNRLFYYSLFDFRSFELDEDFFPAVMVKDFREKTRNILKKIFTQKQPRVYNFLKSRKDFNEFETKVIGTDILGRILISKQLSYLGLKAKVRKTSDFDLEINNINIELKRICLWSSYSDYLFKFLDKINKGDNYIYVVACTHPFVIEKIIPKHKNLKIFNKYIDKIVKSHYIAEKLI
ncbi:MAG TPA: hypothetical protein ENF30_00785, partial [Candidatus Desulfofervidus auxilii]|nr:hypothetical protein [Candidatus Desulfofervidus auxilii]